MVPVVDCFKVPLMPCSEKRARKLMEKGQAKAYWQKGIFCIMLLKEPSQREYQEVVLGLDTGSMREAYTVATKKKVVVNITTNTPYWVKANVATCRLLRRNRRGRKAPYRKMKPNRATNKKVGRLGASTLARWNAKLRMIKLLLSILPIKTMGVEDISAPSKPGKKYWNVSFAPLQSGKTYFYKEIQKLGLHLIKFKGYDTDNHRMKRQFTKLGKGKKMRYVWNAHNVDSHSLCEMAINQNITPFEGLWKVEFMKFYRRQLHTQLPAKNNVRRIYGGTVSMGMGRGSILRYTYKFKKLNYDNQLCYLGGTSNGYISVYSILRGTRENQKAKVKNIKMLYNSKKRVQFIPSNPNKPWKSVQNHI